jgi:hypothetical protein
MLYYTTTESIELRRKRGTHFASRKLILASAVTAIYKGTQQGGAPVILRSYDTRKEPSVEFDCTIWQAGRATSATGLAFKPIQVGQSVFIDEGAGNYNPTPVALDEACVNEWPGREVGVVVSIGTGKRPAGSDQNQQLWYEGFMGEFAEARRRLIAKIEGCEVTHQHMIREGLSKRGVNIENYYRLNVEIGVGEFGMNEWARLADISTGTRRYLAKNEIKAKNDSAALKLAKIHRAKLRFDRESGAALPPSRHKEHLDDVPEAYPTAVELPAEVPSTPPQSPPSRLSYESGHHDNLEVPDRHRLSYSQRASVDSIAKLSPRDSVVSSHSNMDDRFVTQSPTPNQYRTASGADKIAIISEDEFPKPTEQAPVMQQGRVEPPPLPPKTPLDFDSPLPLGRPRPPYPMGDGPPPPVNMARKPDYKGR